MPTRGSRSGFPRPAGQAFDPTAAVPLSADAGGQSVGGEVITAFVDAMARHAPFALGCGRGGVGGHGRRLAAGGPPPASRAGPVGAAARSFRPVGAASRCRPRHLEPAPGSIVRRCRRASSRRAGGRLARSGRLSILRSPMTISRSGKPASSSAPCRVDAATPTERRRRRARIRLRGPTPPPVAWRRCRGSGCCSSVC